MRIVPFPPMKRPLIAILRGLKPEEAEGVVSVLIETGITAIEIPLNSPDPFRSIEIAVKKASAEVLIGAGTVLTPEEVERLHDVGGRLMVTPNVDPEVIARARQRGMVAIPASLRQRRRCLRLRRGPLALSSFLLVSLGHRGFPRSAPFFPQTW
jgi:2-keto-3-deoxy-6-phosphogluconate aldolase